MNVTEIYKRYLDIALLLSERSCCIRRHYGAIIVSEGLTIVSAGFNHVNVDEAPCNTIGFCLREKLKVPKGERYEICKSCHAEMQALITGDPLKMVGGTIFIAGRNVLDNTITDSSPCLICRRMLKFAKLKQCVYAMPDNSNPQEYTVNYMPLNDGILNF